MKLKILEDQRSGGLQGNSGKYFITHGNNHCLRAKLIERNRWLAEALERGDGRAWVARASPPTVTLPRCQPLCTLQLFTLKTPRIYPTDVVCTSTFESVLEKGLRPLVLAINVSKFLPASIAVKDN